MYKIIYAGTPEFSVAALRSLAASEHEVVAVYTQPDRPSGRGRKLQQSAVKSFALDQGLTVCQPDHFQSTNDIDLLKSWQADLMVVAAYGLLLPPAVLEAPRLGCINIHASILPRWRGASPIQQAILAGDGRSGISLMKMDQGLDTGDIISLRDIAIEPFWTAADLHDALAPLGAELLIDALSDLETVLQHAQAQNNNDACYAPRLTKQQAEIDWDQSAEQLDRQIRAYNPWPVSFTRINGDNLRIWKARPCFDYPPAEPGRVLAHNKQGLFVSCRDSVLQILELQFAGKNKWDASQARNACDLTGIQLG